LPLPVPPLFEVVATKSGFSFQRDDHVFAVATRFGGRWRVTDDRGEARLWLAPLGVDGTNDVEVVTSGAETVGSIVRDRREPDRWQVITDAADDLECVAENASELRIMDDGVIALLGMVEGSLRVLFTRGADRLPSSLVLALPLVFLTNGALVPAEVREQH
jgi:hypothetical protein